MTDPNSLSKGAGLASMQILSQMSVLPCLQGSSQRKCLQIIVQGSGDVGIQMKFPPVPVYLEEAACTSVFQTVFQNLITLDLNRRICKCWD